MEKRTLIALGGLLHDIGKFVQRARKEDFKFEEESYNSLLKGNYEDFKYEHAYLSKAFILLLKEEGVIDDELADKLINWGARHHKPTDELESIISQVADWYSSAEREVYLKSDTDRLHSVFERISLKPKEERKNISEYIPKTKEDIPKELKKYFGTYRLEPLKTLKNVLFPVLFWGGFVKEKIGKKEYTIITNLEHYSSQGNYKELFEEFWEEIRKVKGTKDPDFLLNHLYYLLYKYTWCVPASTFDIETASRHYPDISLFDHSRVLSAIAVSIYDWAKANHKKAEDIKPRGGKLPTDDQEVFLLIEGDVGGIQSFIYNIHKASESELSIAKALRGRSFFLTMMPEVFARYILKELGYPITNALFIGGGKFQLLVANTEGNLKRLKEIEEEINRWMFGEFQGELNFSVAWVRMKGSALRVREKVDKDIPQTYLDHIEWLQLELDKKKKRKLGELVFDEFNQERDATSADNICPSCRTLYKDEEEELCYWCDMSQEWGTVLPKVRYVAFDWGEELSVEGIKERKIMSFNKFGNVYLLEEEDLDKVRELPEILNIEDTELKNEWNKLVNGFKFIGHSAPKIPKNGAKGLLQFFNELWREKLQNRPEEYRDKEKLNGGDILPFDLLVEFAEGDKKLGFFRADVDYLGLILSDGLRFNEFGDEELYTISRIATLSRMLDLFFSGYLNKLAEEVSLEFVKNSLEGYKKLEKDNPLSDSDRFRKELLEKVYDRENDKLLVGSLIYTVYSGGDDLFVIAPYDLALEFAKRLRERFEEFTCKNPDFGISGGIYIGSHDTPIHLVAKFAESLEDKAKNSRREKDMICVFESSMKWANRDTADYKGVGYCKCEEEKEEELRKDDFISLEQALEFAERLKEYLEEGKLKRALLYKILSLHKQYVKEQSVNLMIFPKIAYYLARNIKKEHENVRKYLLETLLEGKFSDNGGTDMDPRTVIKNITVPIYIALMKTRKGGEV